MNSKVSRICFFLKRIPPERCCSEFMICKGNWFMYSYTAYTVLPLNDTVTTATSDTSVEGKL